MKRSSPSFCLVGGFLLSLAASACDNPHLQSSSPTAPEATASSNAPFAVPPPSAPTQNQHGLPPDLVFSIVNPCTGLPATLTRHTVKFVFHDNVDASGGDHFTVTSVIEVTTSDGFSGRETVTTGGTFSPGHSGIQEQTFTDSQTIGDGSGQRILVHALMHVVFENGVPIVENSSLRLECLGKPVT